MCWNSFSFISVSKLLKKRLLKKRLQGKKDLTFREDIFDGKYFDKILKALIGKDSMLSSSLKDKFKKKETQEYFRSILKELTRDDDTEVCPQYEKIYQDTLRKCLVM